MSLKTQIRSDCDKTSEVNGTPSLGKIQKYFDLRTEVYQEFTYM